MVQLAAGVLESPSTAGGGGIPTSSNGLLEADSGDDGRTSYEEEQAEDANDGGSAKAGRFVVWSVAGVSDGSAIVGTLSVDTGGGV